MLAEAGAFLAHKTVGFTYCTSLLQTGRRRQLGATRRGRCDEPRSRDMLGETWRRAIAWVLDRYQSPSPGTSQPRERLARGGDLPENERGSRDHRGLLLGVIHAR